MIIPYKKAPERGWGLDERVMKSCGDRGRVWFLRVHCYPIRNYTFGMGLGRRPAALAISDTFSSHSIAII
jgi:hypothetical protein